VTGAAGAGGAGGAGAPARPLLVACLKLVELRSSVDPLSGAVIPDPLYPLSAGASSADEAALEWALRCAERWNGEVTAVSAGSASVEVVLRAALAAGARSAIRIELDPDAVSHVVAGAIANALIDRFGEASDGIVVFCGDASNDRGSGSVPAFLAAELGAAQALGLIGVDVGEEASEGFLVERRLDRGRREILRVVPPCVLSVEGGTARLRRAGLRPTISSHGAEVVVAAAHSVLAAQAHRSQVELVGVEPFRPRARVVPPPPGPSARERILALTGAEAERSTARMLVLSPEEAADELLDALTAWGELPPGLHRTGGDT